MRWVDTGVLQLFYIPFYRCLEVEHIFICLWALQASYGFGFLFLLFLCFFFLNFHSFIEIEFTHLKCIIQGLRVPGLLGHPPHPCPDCPVGTHI